VGIEIEGVVGGVKRAGFSDQESVVNKPRVTTALFFALFADFLHVLCGERLFRPKTKPLTRRPQRTAAKVAKRERERRRKIVAGTKFKLRVNK
jgi:hypothetical protein